MAGSIGRGFDEIAASVKRLGKEIRESQKETRALDAALKLDPSNVDLVKQKYASMAQQLDLSRQKANDLRAQIDALGSSFDSGAIKENDYAARLKDLQKELKLTETQVQGLEGAISKQNEAVASAKLNNLSSGVKNVRESMSGVLTLMRSMDSLIRLVGQSSSEELDASSERLSELEESLDSVKQAYEDGIITQEQYIESTSRLNAEVANEKAVLAELEEQQKKQAETAQRMQTVITIMQSVVGISAVMQQMNKQTGLSFSSLAMGISMAVAAFTVVDSLLGKLPDDIRPAVGAITTLVAAVAAGTVAWMAFHGTMTLGTAIPIILTAVGVGIAGIKAMLPDSAAADVSSTSSSYAGAAANYDFTAATQAATGASPGTTTTNNTTSGDTVIEINVYNPQNADEIMEELQRRLVNSKLSYGR